MTLPCRWGPGQVLRADHVYTIEHGPHGRAPASDGGQHAGTASPPRR
jgi:hypothetical protein